MEKMWEQSPEEKEEAREKELAALKKNNPYYVVDEFLKKCPSDKRDLGLQEEFRWKFLPPPQPLEQSESTSSVHSSFLKERLVVKKKEKEIKDALKKARQEMTQKKARADAFREALQDADYKRALSFSIAFFSGLLITFLIASITTGGLGFVVFTFITALALAIPLRAQYKETRNGFKNLNIMFDPINDKVQNLKDGEAILSGWSKGFFKASFFSSKIFLWGGVFLAVASTGVLITVLSSVAIPFLAPALVALVLSVGVINATRALIEYGALQGNKDAREKLGKSVFEEEKEVRERLEKLEELYTLAKNESFRLSTNNLLTAYVHQKGLSEVQLNSVLTKPGDSLAEKLEAYLESQKPIPEKKGSAEEYYANKNIKQKRYWATLLCPLILRTALLILSPILVYTNPAVAVIVMTVGTITLLALWGAEGLWLTYELIFSDAPSALRAHEKSIREDEKKLATQKVHLKNLKEECAQRLKEIDFICNDGRSTSENINDPLATLKKQLEKQVLDLEERSKQITTLQKELKKKRAAIQHLIWGDFLLKVFRFILCLFLPNMLSLYGGGKYGSGSTFGPMKNGKNLNLIDVSKPHKQVETMGDKVQNTVETQWRFEFIKTLYQKWSGFFSAFGIVIYTLSLSHQIEQKKSEISDLLKNLKDGGLEKQKEIRQLGKLLRKEISSKITAIENPHVPTLFHTLDQSPIVSTMQYDTQGKPQFKALLEGIHNLTRTTGSKGFFADLIKGFRETIRLEKNNDKGDIIKAQLEEVFSDTERALRDDFSKSHSDLVKNEGDLSQNDRLTKHFWNEVHENKALKELAPKKNRKESSRMEPLVLLENKFKEFVQNNLVEKFVLAAVGKEVFFSTSVKILKNYYLEEKFSTSGPSLKNFLVQKAPSLEQEQEQEQSDFFEETFPISNLNTLDLKRLKDKEKSKFRIESTFFIRKRRPPIPHGTIISNISAQEKSHGCSLL